MKLRALKAASFLASGALLLATPVQASIHDGCKAVEDTLLAAERASEGWREGQSFPILVAGVGGVHEISVRDNLRPLVINSFNISPAYSLTENVVDEEELGQHLVDFASDIKNCSLLENVELESEEETDTHFRLRSRLTTNEGKIINYSMIISLRGPFSIIHMFSTSF